MAGSTATALLYPLDLIKIRLQVNEQAVDRRSSSLLSTQFSAEIRTLLRAERSSLSQKPNSRLLPSSLLKYRALYSGLSPSLLGNGLSWGGYFFVYDGAKKVMLSEEKHKNTSADFLLASCLSG